MLHNLNFNFLHTRLKLDKALPSLLVHLATLQLLSAWNLLKSTDILATAMLGRTSPCKTKAIQNRFVSHNNLQIQYQGHLIQK